MKISKKRLLSLLLAFVMALSLSPTALLEGTDGDSGETPGGQDRLSITLAQGINPINPESGIVLAQEAAPLTSKQRSPRGTLPTK